MAINDLLSKLDRVKHTGPGRWIASSPTRSDSTPSLSIRELDDGRILIHDFGGDSVEDVLSAIGLSMTDLFPARQIQHGKPERRPFPASDILRCVAFEALVVMSAASAKLTGKPLADVDRERLSLAVSRLQVALEAGGLADA